MTPGRVARWIGAVGLGTLLGMVGVLALQNPIEPATPTPVTVRATNTTTSARTSVSSLPTWSTLFVIWTPGGLPEELADLVRGLPGVENVSEIRSDLALIDAVYDARGAVIEDAPDGWYVPIEVAAIDANFAGLAPGEWHASLAGLSAGEAIIGETSAAIRRVGVGSTIASRGVSHITAVLPDVVVGGTELLVTQEEGEALGIQTPRYLLVVYGGDRAPLERSVRTFLPPEKPARIRALGETPFLRHGDAVLPQVLIKEAFGEFMVRPTSSGDVEFDPSWAESNIVSESYPLIGNASCHAGITTALRGALEELERNNLGSLIETLDGCFNPRFISGTELLSRHAWGVAIDLNYASNPTGQVTVQDPRLVATMEKWGFGWGGNWLIPDAAHFEWIGSPKP